MKDLSLLQLILLGIVGTHSFLLDDHRFPKRTCRHEGNDGTDRAQRIMYNQQSRKREGMRYQIIAVEACEPLARRMEEVRVNLPKSFPNKFDENPDIHILDFFFEFIFLGLSRSIHFPSDKME